MTTLDAFTRAFFECALWSSTDESRDDGGDPLDDTYTIDDIAPACLKALARECEEWQQTNAEALEACYAWSESNTTRAPLDDEHAGHDFWLNRNGHGCGFWDGDWPEPWADTLDTAAEAAGHVDAYVGDDGLIYFTGYETGKRFELPVEKEANG